MLPHMYVSCASFACACRPYYTIHDDTFTALANGALPGPDTNVPCLLGITNLYFVRALGNWPNILSVGRKDPRCALCTISCCGFIWPSTPQADGACTHSHMPQYSIAELRGPAALLHLVQPFLLKKAGRALREVCILRFPWGLLGGCPHHFGCELAWQYASEEAISQTQYFVTELPTGATVVVEMQAVITSGWSCGLKTKGSNTYCRMVLCLQHMARQQPRTVLIMAAQHGV